LESTNHGKPVQVVHYNIKGEIKIRVYFSIINFFLTLYFLQITNTVNENTYSITYNEKLYQIECNFMTSYTRKIRQNMFKTNTRKTISQNITTTSTKSNPIHNFIPSVKTYDYLLSLISEELCRLYVVAGTVIIYFWKYKSLNRKKSHQNYFLGLHINEKVCKQNNVNVFNI